MHAVSLGHVHKPFMARVRAGREVITFPPACFYGSTVIMKKSIKVAPKRRGRPPAGGRDPGVHIRLPEPMLAAIDARSIEDGTTRSEAIRRLVEIGLKVKTPAKTVAKPGRRTRARELATEVIEKIVDPAAPPEELERRRQRLTKGPPEFREARVDQPKAKGK
jgi:Ribbon-helix-helix protein, copG family